MTNVLLHFSAQKWLKIPSIVPSCEQLYFQYFKHYANYYNKSISCKNIQVDSNL